jgi:hypothetical protein
MLFHVNFHPTASGSVYPRAPGPTRRGGLPSACPHEGCRFRILEATCLRSGGAMSTGVPPARRFREPAPAESAGSFCSLNMRNFGAGACPRRWFSPLAGAAKLLAFALYAVLNALVLRFLQGNGGRLPALAPCPPPALGGGFRRGWGKRSVSAFWKHFACEARGRLC